MLHFYKTTASTMTTTNGYYIFHSLYGFFFHSLFLCVRAYEMNTVFMAVGWSPHIKTTHAHTHTKQYETMARLALFSLSLSLSVYDCCYIRLLEMVIIIKFGVLMHVRYTALTLWALGMYEESQRHVFGTFRYIFHIFFFSWSGLWV